MLICQIKAVDEGNRCILPSVVKSEQIASPLPSFCSWAFIRETVDFRESGCFVSVGLGIAEYIGGAIRYAFGNFVCCVPPALE